MRSRRTAFILIGVLAIALISRSDPAARWLQGALGPRAALLLPAQSAPHERDTHAAVAEPPGPAPVRAAAPGDGATSVTVTAEPSAKTEQGYILAARLLTKDAKPLNEVTVRFYDVVELLGLREMLIGSAATDTQGRATLAYLPAEAGRHEIVTRSSEGERIAATEGRLVFDATLAAPPAYSPEELPLASFSTVVPYVAGAVALGVWVLFAVALLGTGRRILVGARVATPPLRTARGAAGVGPVARSKAREDHA